MTKLRLSAWSPHALDWTIVWKSLAVCLALRPKTDCQRADMENMGTGKSYAMGARLTGTLRDLVVAAPGLLYTSR